MAMTCTSAAGWPWLAEVPRVPRVPILWHGGLVLGQELVILGGEGGRMEFTH